MRKTPMVLSALLLALPLAAQADHHEAPAAEAAQHAMHAEHADHAEQAMAPAMGAEKKAFLFAFDGTAKKLTSLAEAFPEATYAWRPAEGVRSVAESFQHVAGSVYYLTLMMGVTPPAGHPQSFPEAGALEKMVAKGEVAESLAKSLAFARQVAVGAGPEALAKEVDFFGNKVDGRTVFLLLQGHLDEHLGQLIAYARMNGVVPPWSRGEGG